MSFCRLLSHSVCLLGAVFLVACSSAPEPKSQNTPPPKVSFPEAKDQSARLPKGSLEKSELTTGPMLGVKGMPPGTVAHYSRNGKQWRVAAGDAGDDNKAALLLFDWKSQLPEPKFIAHFGGYYGQGPNGPVFVFSKKQWLLAIEGLPQEAADVIAREVAGRF